jgi:hypothetical protein
LRLVLPAARGQLTWLRRTRAQITNPKKLKNMSKKQARKLVQV